MRRGEVKEGGTAPEKWKKKRSERATNLTRKMCPSNVGKYSSDIKRMDDKSGKEGSGEGGSGGMGERGGWAKKKICNKEQHWRIGPLPTND